jgi:hypothetical protein
MSKDLNPQNALIFRIVHRDNMGNVWAHGLHWNASHGKKYTQIGNPELISTHAHLKNVRTALAALRSKQASQVCIFDCTTSNAAHCDKASASF